jgi:hypothetical protein
MCVGGVVGWCVRVRAYVYVYNIEACQSRLCTPHHVIPYFAHANTRAVEPHSCLIPLLSSLYTTSSFVVAA